MLLRTGAQVKPRIKFLLNQKEVEEKEVESNVGEDLIAQLRVPLRLKTAETDRLKTAETDR